jgi:exodeoxyribonuclease VIII
MNRDDYHKNLALGSGDLKLILDAGPENLAWARKVHTPGSDATELGTAFHTMVLEPGNFTRQYIRAERFNRRTKEGKAAEAEFIAQAEKHGRIVLDDSDYQLLADMEHSLECHPAAQRLIEACEIIEQPEFATDMRTGVQVKCLPDMRAKYRPIIADLKTVADIGRLQRHILDYRWHVQAAHYSRICAETCYAGETPQFWFIAVDKHRRLGRHEIRVFRLGELTMLTGKNEVNSALSDWVDYTSYVRAPDQIMDLPEWALAEY